MNFPRQCVLTYNVTAVTVNFSRCSNVFSERSVASFLVNQSTLRCNFFIVLCVTSLFVNIVIVNDHKRFLDMVDNNEPDTLISTVGELMKYLNEQGEHMAKMSNSIEELSIELSVKYNTPPTSQTNQMSTQERKREIMSKIESVFIHLLQQVSQNKLPVLRIRDAKSWNNCFFKDK